MFRVSFLQRVLFLGLLTIPIACGSALAQRGERGGRSDNGGGGGEGGRSYNRGGGDGGGSSRSFSGGEGGGNSGRPWRGGESSFPGMSSRSFRGESAPSSGGNASRFSGSRSEAPSRSFGGGSPRTFSDGSSGNAPAIRSLDGRSFSRSFEGTAPSSRSFSVPPRGAFDSGPTSRSFQRGPSSDQPASADSFRRGFNRGSNDAPQFSRSGPQDSNSGNELSNRPSFSRRVEGGESNLSFGELNRSRVDSGSSPSSNRREYTAGRPTNEQVQEFLRMRREAGSSSQRGNVSAGSGNAGQREFGGNFNRGDGNRGAADAVTDVARQQNFRNRVNESQSEGDRSWAQRFGGNRGDDVSRGENDPGEQPGRGNNDRPRPGDFARRPGDSNRFNDGRGDNNRDANDSFRQRDFGDRNFVDGKYQSWRKHAWRGDDGNGHDHRDWSGRWKDGDRFAAAHRIRNHWDRDWDRHDFPFCGGWNSRHWHGGHNHWNRWNYWNNWASVYRRPYHWWGWCSAPRLTTWVTFGWNRPYYWDYGPGEYIYCDNNVIYVNGRWFQPAPIYYENAVVLAQKVPDWTPEKAQQVEWLPLGVFAVARDGVADTNLLVQLAVTKDGVIGGTASNQATGASFPIEGTVDKETQRAVWMYTDDKNARIVMETSVYNLTQPEATGLVHYGPDDIQVVELVRLEQPEGGAAPATAPRVVPVQ